ncbi:uncharacterized protein LOC123562085 [Mercenaria mercenaria]|uniref:uncharacterized protein LOC123562085 n=1 Tax=Mercenaria mercenaria TaxID=6596 RepID=UPI00234F67BC|nr:uncharacterized protein LOC123562085 [Mercenaria mercenaria]
MSAFAKNFYKLMNNSCFGKTMENVRKHKNIELVHNERRLLKLSSKSTYKTTTIFNEDLTAVELYRVRVLMNKPIYSGMCILDLSKWAMYDFYYNKLKNTFGEQMTMCLTDTDSILFYVESFDVYQYMKENIHLFDTSDYPQNHFLYSEENKKKVGSMKDEMSGIPISAFVGLRSKVYSFKCDNNKEEKRAKGIAKATLKRDLRFTNYKDILFSEGQNVVTITSIRNDNHELYCNEMKKIGLSSFDDKRYLLNATDSLAYGHYSLRQSQVEEERARTPSILPEEGSLFIDNCKVTPLTYKLEHLTSTPTLLEDERSFIADCSVTPVTFK